VGRNVFSEQWCGVCHGIEAKGIRHGISDIREMSADTAASMKSIVIDGADRTMACPPSRTSRSQAWMRYAHS
jgi:mono/diheme cytochrome c family protein